MGGHVFTATTKAKVEPVTIDQVQTITSEILTEIDIDVQHSRLLGSSLISLWSNDIDIAIDASAISKDQLFEKLSDLVKRNGLPQEVKKTGSMLHILYPIPDTDNFVQVDFIVGNAKWLEYTMRGEHTGTFKGKHRNILLSSIATSQGYKWSMLHGLSDRDFTSNDKLVHYLVGPGDPIEWIAKILICEQATYRDIESVESILKALEKYRRMSMTKLIRDAQATVQHEGKTFL